MAVHGGGDRALCRLRCDLPLVVEVHGRYCMTAAGDDSDNYFSTVCPVQHSALLMWCSLSRDHPDRLEASESEGQHGNER